MLFGALGHAGLTASSLQRNTIVFPNALAEMRWVGASGHSEDGVTVRPSDKRERWFEKGYESSDIRQSDTFSVQRL